MALTLPEVPSDTVFTHFSQDFRVHIRLKGEDKARAIQHIQGVDTFSISSKLLEHKFQEKHIKSMIQFFHETCPASFYQDDYIISLIFNLLDIKVHSLWNDEKVAMHIDGVSKSNNQMHMHPEVMNRENETKECITLNAEVAYSILDGASWPSWTEGSGEL